VHLVTLLWKESALIFKCQFTWNMLKMRKQFFYKYGTLNVSKLYFMPLDWKSIARFKKCQCLINCIIL